MSIETYSRLASGPTDAAEQLVFQRVLSIIDRRGEDAVILVNLFHGRHEIDLVVATRTSTLVIEVKGYSQAVEGDINSPSWRTVTTGERRSNAYAKIDSAHMDLKDALRRVTGGKGVDVIYDPVGGRFSEPALRSIAWQGRFLVIGFAAGDIPKLPLNLVLLKGCDVLGVFWGSFIERDLAGHRANIEQIMRWCLEGKVSSHIHAAYPLAESAAALKSIADRKVMGKVILKM